MSHKSNQWKNRQSRDPWVKAAQKSAWRSRAVFKLQELDVKGKLFKRGMQVLDLGAAPGSWSQYAMSKIGSGGRVVAVDLLEMQPLPGVQFVQGDVQHPAVLERALAFLGGRVDLVMSDMSPNITGMASIDIPRALALAETAVNVASKTLTNGGVFLVKLFQGEGFREYLIELKRCCVQVAVKKPSASRSESREMYVLARF